MKRWFLALLLLSLPVLLGANRMVFAPRAEVAWDDIRCESNNLRINPNSSKPDYGADGEFWTYLFDAATAESVFVRIQIPHDYQLGTTLHPHIHWAATSAAAGNVQWKIRYSFADIGEAFSASDTMSVVDASGGDNVHMVAELGTINGSSITAPSAMIRFVIWRDAAADGDTYGADAAIEEFDVHYRRDSNGSRWEYVK